MLVALFLGFLFSCAEAASNRWQECVNGTGFLVPDARRCIDFSGGQRDRTKMENADNQCNDTGGRLFHLYSSLEHQLFMEWLEATYPTEKKRAWIGLRRYATAELNPTNTTNYYWMYPWATKLDNLTLKELYNPMQWDTNPFSSGLNKSTCATIGVCKSGCSSNEAQYYGLISWSPNCRRSDADIRLKSLVICEWLSPSPWSIPATFKAQSGKRLNIHTIQPPQMVQTELICARFCWSLPHCQGFNVRAQNSSRICELHGKRLADANTTLEMDPASEYFQLQN